MKCNLFYCDKVGERICCKSCRLRSRCRNRCLNSPDRCGQAAEKPVGKPKGRITSLS